MPFNGSGLFQRVRNWVNDATAGIKIRADYHDAEDDNLAAGLSNTITRDGQSQILQNIPWNNKRITGLADPVNPQDASTKAYADTKLSSAGGGTLTGDMTIKKDAPTLVLDSTGAGGSAIQGLKNGKTRWLMRLGNDVAESGANAGSDFDIHRYADDAAYLGQALSINRATGAWTIPGQVTFNGNPIAAGGAIHLRGWGGDGNQGVVFFTAANDKYIYYSGGRFGFVGGPISAGEPQGGGDLATVNYVNGRTAFTPVQQGGGAHQGGSKVYIGWDGGGVRVQIDGTDMGRIFFGGGNFVTDGRLSFAGDVSIAWGPQGTTPGEPFSGTVITGWSWTNSGGFPYMNHFRLRNMQLHTTGWYTVGYA